MPNRPARRTALIFGGYAVAFAVIAIAQLLGLPPMVRFVLAVVALATGAIAVGEGTERLAHPLRPPPGGGGGCCPAGRPPRRGGGPGGCWAPSGCSPPPLSGGGGGWGASPPRRPSVPCPAMRCSAPAPPCPPGGFGPPPCVSRPPQTAS